jgi:hypothetical protein
VTNATAQSWRAGDNLEAVPPGETAPLLLAHLTAKRGLAMHRDNVRIGDEVGGKQTQGVANLPVHQGAPGHICAVGRDHRQVLVPQMQFNNSIARPNEPARLEQDIALSGTQSDTEDALDVVGVFMHTVTAPEQPIERLDRRFCCGGASRPGCAVHYDGADHIPRLPLWGRASHSAGSDLRNL